MTGEHASQTTLPQKALRPAWRSAAAAYRRVRAEGKLDEPAWLAARAAVIEVHPHLDEKAAGAIATDAIAFASVQHPDWFWGRKKRNHGDNPANG